MDTVWKDVGKIAGLRSLHCKDACMSRVGRLPGSSSQLRRLEHIWHSCICHQLWSTGLSHKQLEDVGWSQHLSLLWWDATWRVHLPWNCPRIWMWLTGLSQRSGTAAGFQSLQMCQGHQRFWWLNLRPLFWGWSEGLQDFALSDHQSMGDSVVQPKLALTSGRHVT